MYSHVSTQKTNIYKKKMLIKVWQFKTNLLQKEPHFHNFTTKTKYLQQNGSKKMYSKIQQLESISCRKKFHLMTIHCRKQQSQQKIFRKYLPIFCDGVTMDLWRFCHKESITIINRKVYIFHENFVIFESTVLFLGLCDFHAFSSTRYRNYDVGLLIIVLGNLVDLATPNSMPLFFE